MRIIARRKKGIKMHCKCRNPNNCIAFQIYTRYHVVWYLVCRTSSLTALMTLAPSLGLG